MLTSHEIFRMVDENKQNEFQIEVNWNPKDDKSNNCQLIKFNFPSGSAVIKREHLFSILFACGTEDQQRKSIPQKLSQVRYLKTVLGVKATKDIVKGEMVNFPVEIALPPIEEEVVMGIKEVANKHA